MISRENYEKLEELYGYVSSWAIWKRPGVKPTSNTDDMSIFDDPNVLSILNPKYVFVGFNGSSTHGAMVDGADRPWMNFHSGDAKKQHDFKLRYALMDTPYWGSYMCDIIKNHTTKDAAQCKADLRNNPDLLRTNIESFEQELSYLDEHPVLIAMGGDAHDILNPNFSNKYEIKLIPHPAARGEYLDKDDYKFYVHYELGIK